MKTLNKVETWYIIDGRYRQLNDSTDKIEAEKMLQLALYRGFNAYITNEKPKKLHPQYKDY